MEKGTRGHSSRRDGAGFCSFEFHGENRIFALELSRHIGAWRQRRALAAEIGAVFTMAQRVEGTAGQQEDGQKEEGAVVLHKGRGGWLVG